MKRPRGFTLIELLIVVVILAVLAALVVPRFLSQPEKAVVSKANMMLGAIVRAQSSCVDSGACLAPLALSAGSPNWATLGMGEPISPSFTYDCAGGAGSSCTATRTNAGTIAYDGAIVSVTVANPPVWDCDFGPGSSASYSNLPEGGCST
jgi:prepilin-type N-terminal cleavage/methylation domain-containing protein